MQVQYVMFMMIFFGVFMVVSVLATPAAYFVCMFDKIKTIGQQTSLEEKIKNNLIFIPFGLPILYFDLIADMFYFWKNNFKSS